MTRFSTPFVGIVLITMKTQMAWAEPVRFHAKQYGCELTVFGVSRGRVEPDKPFTTDLPRGREYLVECESHDIPVKLYARNYVGSFGRGMPMDVTVAPVAVLPNVVRAAAKGRIVVTAIADSNNVSCKVKKKDPNSPFQDESHQIAPEQSYHLLRGTVVTLTGSPPLHCGDTNLIEVSIDDSKAWFPNKDFSFSYMGLTIPLYSPSQDFECCWIE